MTAVSVTHIGELPEVRRYHDDGKHNFMLHGGFGIRYIRESIADAALAAAGREVERLRDILSLRDSDLAHFEKSVEDAAAALEVCDVTLATWASTLANHAGFEHRTAKDMDELLTWMEEQQQDDGDEVERLRCCGNCYGSGYHGGAFGCFRDVDHLFINTEPRDNCHFDPSRWTRRETP